VIDVIKKDAEKLKSTIVGRFRRRKHFSLGGEEHSP
jgi:hypothetical protein